MRRNSQQSTEDRGEKSIREIKRLRCEVHTTNARLNYLTRYIQHQRGNLRNLVEKVQLLQQTVDTLSSQLPLTVSDCSVVSRSLRESPAHELLHASPDLDASDTSRTSVIQPNIRVSKSVKRLSQAHVLNGESCQVKKKRRRRSYVVPAELRVKRKR
ncbi:hypothetical protein EG68_05338 [Paragonimus skrjabini miyazakii]|uniref:Uncharacterized protein n=1 Tax=Paragonimus skrjabini miyazakii TaxID=59628 RepID=A0A8S9YV63_9TREM|nr:hypothetical protein EG68_05338 [Paragonimus skrjabini miyazakii]